MSLAPTITTIVGVPNPSLYGQNVVLTSLVTATTSPIIQKDAADVGTPSTTVNFPSPPTAGNTLVFCVSGIRYAGITPPAGLIQQSTYHATTYGFNWYSYVFTRVVQPGDPQQWIFTSLGGSFTPQVLGFEILGTPSLAYLCGPGTESGTYFYSPSISPPANSVVLAAFFGGTNTSGWGIGPTISPPIYQWSYQSQAPSSLSAMVWAYGSPPTGVITMGSPTCDIGVSIWAMAYGVDSGIAVPGGTVDLVDSISGPLASGLPLVSGQATYNTSSLDVNTHDITSTYSGSGSYLTSHGSVMQVVDPGGPTVTAVTTSQSPSVSGHSVTFTVSVTPVGGGSPTGTVILTDSHGDFAPQTLSLTGSYMTSALSVGSHVITATYSGDSDFSASYGTVAQEVDSKYATFLTLTSSQDPQAYGSAFTLDLSVSSPFGTPTGTLALSDSIVGPIASGSVPSISFTMDPSSSWSVGSHLVTASYSGDADFQSSTATLIQLVINSRGEVLHDVPGFAIFSGYSPSGDVFLPSWATFSASPSTTTAGTPVYILWTSNNVATVEMMETTTSPPVNILLSTTGSGIYEFTGGFSTSTVVACTAYDGDGNIVTTENVLITIT
jgi:hypothetical protein